MRVACVFFKKEVSVAAFAEACLRFSPQMAVREPNILLIEIGKCLKLYSELNFRHRLRILLDRFGHPAQIALADDIPTAMALAKFPQESLETLPLECLFDFADPFGNDDVGKKSLYKMVESLSHLGLKTLNDFKALPVSQVPSRFGALGYFCRSRIAEAGLMAWPLWRAPERIVEQITLLEHENYVELEPLLFRMKTALDRVFLRLCGKSLRADEIRITLDLEKYSSVLRPKRVWNFEFISPLGSTSTFLPILRERLSWDLQENPIESQVLAIHVEVLTASLRNDSQSDFFNAQNMESEKLGSFFGQIEEFLGKGKVYWSSVNEERYPEKSWQRLRFPSGKSADIKDYYPKRPTRLLQSPVPLTMLDNKVFIKGKAYEIEKCSQVERLSLDWLNDMPARNYYEVDLKSGLTLWIFSDSSHHFFMHGYFE